RHRNSHEKPYQCVAGDCSMSFSQRQALDRHILAKHGDTNNPTRFACSIPLCQTTFRRKGDLTRHLESVHGPRAHSCQVCSRQFNRKDKLIEHQ
ncbi:hypothetical protein DL95DRAFT_270885, partial [Leptodontidium sp. 2 PMI_412]